MYPWAHLCWSAGWNNPLAMPQEVSWLVRANLKLHCCWKAGCYSSYSPYVPIVLTQMSQLENDPARKAGKWAQLPNLPVYGAVLRERWDSRSTEAGVTSTPAAAWPLMVLIQTALYGCSTFSISRSRGMVWWTTWYDEPGGVNRTGLPGSMGCSSSARGHTVGISYSVQLLYDGSAHLGCFAVSTISQVKLSQEMVTQKQTAGSRTAVKSNSECSMQLHLNPSLSLQLSVQHNLKLNKHLHLHSC